MAKPNKAPMLLSYEERVLIHKLRCLKKSKRDGFAVLSWGREAGDLLITKEKGLEPLGTCRGPISQDE